MQVATILAKLKKVKRYRWGWQACCPAHRDENPSLTVLEGDNKVVLTCHAGCTYQSILEALGLEKVTLDLDHKLGARIDNEPKKDRKMTRKSASNKFSSKNIIARYDYTDADNGFLYQIVRFEPKTFAVQTHDWGSPDWTWGFNNRPQVLYRLKELFENQERHVVIVEGEKCVDRLQGIKIMATTNPLGAGKGYELYRSTLVGREVTIIPDNDVPGKKHALEIALALKDVASGVRVLELPGLGEAEDVCEWLDRGGDRQALIELCRKAEVMHRNPGVKPLPRPARFATERMVDQGPSPFAGANEEAVDNSPEDEVQHVEVEVVAQPISVANVAALISERATLLTPAEFIVYARGRLSDLETQLDYEIGNRVK